MTIGGNVCVRNGIDLDYCWRESIQSLLPVCDIVVACDGESTDGTQEEIREWMKREPKLRLCVYPWPDPKNDNNFWVTWLNYCREHIDCDYQLQLDADEVLAEWSYPVINDYKQRFDGKRFSLWCNRLNFWSDSKHLVPHGVCCGHKVVRLAPQNVWLPSDGPHPLGSEAIAMAIDSPVEIFHYGFLREREAFFRKAKALQNYFFGGYDSRLTAAEERTDILIAEGSPGNWMEHCGMEWLDRLIPYAGPHPAGMGQWLEKRGYSL